MTRLAAAATVAVVVFGTALYIDNSPMVLGAAESTPRADSPDSEELNLGSPPAPEEEAPSEPVTEDEAEKEALELRAASSHGYVERGDRQSVYATFDVTGGEADGDRRPGLDVALVVDRSGSMSGEKIRQARSAAHTIVDRLGERDNLSIISYSDRARVHAESREVAPTAESELHASVDEIGVAGGTNVGEGLQEGLEAVRGESAGPKIDRVILLSDGKPTVGVESTSTLANMVAAKRSDGASVTTMGVGVDYNEDLMTEVANSGGGNYYFIDRAGETDEIFERELTSLAETVAADASLRLEVGGQFDVESVRGHAHRRDNGDVKVALSDVSAGETKSVLLELEGELDGDEPSRLVEAELDWRVPNSHDRGDASVQLTSAATDDAEKIEASTHPDVMARVQEVEAAESLNRAMEAFENGNEEQAKQVIRKRRRRMKRVVEEHDIDESAVEGASKELEEAKSKIQTFDSGSRDGKEAVKRQKETSFQLIRDSSAK